MNSTRSSFRLLRGAALQQRTRAMQSVQRSQFSGFPGLPGFAPGPAPSASIPMPYITEVTNGGWRTSDIFSKLLQERIVCLNGTIDSTVSAAIVAQLLWLESDAPEKPITMYINSGGGEVNSGLAIYDTMTYIKSPVSTVCVGEAASMAAVLLIGGEPGKRYALPNSSIMVHQPLGGTRGQASDIMIYANQIQRLRERLSEIVRSHLNKSFGYEKYGAQEVHDMMDRDNYLTAEESKAHGIIDQVLYKRPAGEAEDKGEKGEKGEKSNDGEKGIGPDDKASK